MSDEKICETSYLHKNEQKYKDCYDEFEGPIGGDDRFLAVFNEFFRNTKGKRILEIGCGEGSFLARLKSSGNDVYGVDISESGVRKTAEKGIPCARVDVSGQDLPLEEESFDIGVTLETIEHIENPRRCIREMKRVVKKDGIIIVSIPNPILGHEYYYPGLFSLKPFKEFLELNNLEIKKVLKWGQGLKTNFLIKKLHDKDRKGIEVPLYKVLYYILRKRNMLMKKFGTPIRFSHSIHFCCINHK